MLYFFKTVSKCYLVDDISTNILSESHVLIYFKKTICSVVTGLEAFEKQSTQNALKL